MRKKFERWLPLAVAITVLAGTIYVAVQQDMRQSFNDTQIAIAEDAAHDMLVYNPDPLAIKNLYGYAVNFSVSSLDPNNAPVEERLTNVSDSLTPYVIVYDDNGQPITSSAILDGTTPIPPQGVFAYAKLHGEDRLTWQPDPGVRQAIVVVHHGGAAPGFVLAGANMRELEVRERNILALSLFGWAAALVLSFAVILLV